MINCQLATAYLLFFFIHEVISFGFGTKPVTPPTDLTPLLRPMPDHPTYAHALELLSSLKTSPSCMRLATQTLMDSCQSIDGSKESSEASLDDLRSLYAAQLAVCELVGASSVIPKPCKGLAPVPETNLRQNKETKGVRKDRLGHCLEELHTGIQSWTSYSNNRQNAVVICQASRMDVEKGGSQPIML